jgi:peptidylprolyl isomerase
MPRTALAALVAALLVLAGCGSGENALDDGPSKSDNTTKLDCDAFRSTVTEKVDAEGTPDAAVPDAAADELCSIDITVGDGDEITQADADAGTEVEVNYVGVGQTTKKEFDSSYKRKQTTKFPLNGVIEGWTKGLVGMKVGGRRELIIPGDLAYGANPSSPDIEPNETLVFVVDLVSKAKTPEPQPNPEVSIPEAPATELVTKDVKVGTGGEITQADADNGVTVEVNYVGIGQSTKKVFDSSYTRGAPVSFPLNRVIEGWTKGLVGMKEGGRREITIPGSLGYGATPPDGSGIQPDETLVFVVDLLSIER